MNYWCYRIDTNHIKFFVRELSEGRLRQGYGWDIKQDLRNLKFDGGVRRNRPMFNKVKKGDILLIPQMPDWGYVSLVEATEDWNIGYRFEIDDYLYVFGHIFPAKYIKKFTRYNEKVTGNLRSTLKNRSRFWNINRYSEDVEILKNTEDCELEKGQDHKSRLENSIGSVFNEVFKENDFEDKLYNKLTEQFSREEWEFALMHGLREMFPYYQITREGGPDEKNHGTDILIKLPSILSNYEYAIAIQVKDYDRFVSDDVVNQINKADSYWNNENLKLIDKIVIITRAHKENNLHLSNDNNVVFIFAEELKKILSEIGKHFIGMK